MIPNKSTFKFQELTPITGVKPYVLRFWEVEFEEIDPVTSDVGDKLYTRKDIEIILKIKKLLFDDKMSVTEAKASLRSRDLFIDQNMTSSDQRGDFTEVREAIISSLNLIRDIKIKQNW